MKILKIKPIQDEHYLVTFQTETNIDPQTVTAYKQKILDLWIEETNQQKQFPQYYKKGAIMKLKKLYLNEYEKHVKTKDVEFDTTEQYITVYTNDDNYPKVKLYYRDLLTAVNRKVDYLNSKKES